MTTSGGDLAHVSDAGTSTMFMDSNEYNVMMYGAVGDGDTDDTAGIQAAIDAADAAGGGTVYIPRGTYLLEDSLTVGDYILVRGDGRVATTLKRGFTGNLITSFGGKSSLQDLTIDGETGTWGAGQGVRIASGKPGQFISNVEITDFSQACLVFPADSGVSAQVIGCQMYTTGNVDSVGAITVEGDDTIATSRHFSSNESGGCTLYNFGGASDAYVHGGYTANLIFGTNSDKVLISNMRIGAAGDTIRIRGVQHRLTGSVSAIPIRVGGTANEVSCEAPDWAISDIGTNNIIDQRLVTFVPEWTASSSNPSIGNGTITASYARDGSIITAYYSLSFGTTTSAGSGVWRFALPVMDNSSVVCAGGSGFVDAATDSNLVFIPRTSPGNQYCTLWAYNNTSDQMEQIQDTSLTWGTSAVIRFFISYFAR